MTPQPYYMVDFSAAACRFEIRVNDYPVVSMHLEGQVSSIIPINYAILSSGPQTITATMLPLKGETALDQKAYSRFKVMEFSVANDFEFVTEFEEFHSKPIASETIPIIAEIQNFAAIVPYTLQAWQNGRDLKDVRDLNKKLRYAIDQLSEAIRNKAFQSFRDRLQKREQNMKNAMYLSQSESDQRMTDLLSDFESGFILRPVPPDALLQLYAENKVAAFKKWNGESAFYLENPQTKEELMLDITFYIPEGAEEFQVI